ncbi:MAG: hypothetical protein ACI865_000889 [Flavobacteriaceae bacterium]|jgi:hypothetical protein
MNTKLLFTIGSIFFFQVLVIGQVTVGGGLRYQLDDKKKIKHYPISDIKENFGVHFVPSLEFEYQKKHFVIQLGLGYFRGEDAIYYAIDGPPDNHFGPDFTYERYSWRYMQVYTYLTPRIAIGYRLMQKSNFNLDFGLFYSTDFLINEENKEHVYTHVEGTEAYTDAAGTFHPKTESVKTSYTPFQLLSFADIYTYTGVRIAPQIKIKHHLTIGIELNVKFQWNYRISSKMQLNNLGYYDNVALDYAIRIGYVLGK